MKYRDPVFNTEMRASKVQRKKQTGRGKKKTFYTQKRYLVLCILKYTALSSKPFLIYRLKIYKYTRNFN